MTVPQWLKPGIYGAIFGAILLSIIGFNWGGWMTGGGANKLAKDVSRDSVITALVPICLYLAQNDENRNLKLLGYKDASSYKRRDMVMDAGWATMPGSSIPDRELAQACTDELLN